MTAIAISGSVTLEPFSCETFFDALALLGREGANVSTVDTSPSVRIQMLKDNLVDNPLSDRELFMARKLITHDDQVIALGGIAVRASVTYLLDARGNRLAQLVTR